MVYCSSSLSLAALEVLVHLPPAMRRKGALPPLVAVALDVPDTLIEDSGQLATPNDGDSRAMGDIWLRSGRSLGLIVPSRVIQQEQNIVLNPRHPRIAEVSVILTQPFAFDDRLAY